MNWIFVLAIGLHMTWAVALLIDERSAWTTSLFSIYTLCGSSAVFTAMLLFGVSFLALAAINKKMGKFFRLILLSPQQVVLVLSAYGAFTASLNSSFADGVVRPFWFIFADQFPAIMTCLAHTGAFLDISRDSIVANIDSYGGHG